MAITDEAGAVVERLSYDAWGKRRNIDGTDDPAGSLVSQTTRGFTGHEQLTEVGLVHMNGRVYDPLIGRFGAPDPMTESPYSTQGWNRYSYVGNSPLNFADPSGYCFLGCFWQKPFKALAGAIRRTPILGSILQVAGAIACGPGAFVCVGLVSAAITGLASGDLGQALRAGLIAGVTAAAMFQVGELTGGFAGADPISGGHGPLEFLSDAHLFNMAGHAAVGCVSAVASGSKCGPGALSGAVGSFATPLTEGMSFTPRLVITSVSGGLASVAGGGKFGNGALTAGFGYLFNRFALWNKNAQLEKDFHEALDYLRKDPTMAKLIDALDKSSDVYNIMFHGGGAEANEYQYLDGQHIINWDTRGGAILEGSIFSPALLLGHELGHAAFGELNYYLADIDAPGSYSNMAE